VIRRDGYFAPVVNGFTARRARPVQHGAVAPSDPKERAVMRRSLLLGLVLAAAAAGSSAAQEAGGVAIAPAAAGGLSGLARLPDPVFPGLAAQGLEAGTAPADRQAGHQAMIARLRGDPGYLAGFAFGQPLAASRVLPVAAPPFALGGPGLVGPGGLALPQPVVIDNFGGPIAVANGDGNVIQQATAGSGTVGQQQVATVGGGAPPSAGASNLVQGGNVVQGAPAGGRRGTERGEGRRRRAGAARSPH
jgi:hypothetical protein